MFNGRDDNATRTAVLLTLADNQVVTVSIRLPLSRRLADALKEGLKRPVQKEFKEVVNKILKAKSEVLMRQLARDLYETLS